MKFFVQLFTVSLFLVSVIFAPAALAADAKSALNCGADLQLKTEDCGTGGDASGTLTDTIKTAINIITVVVGVVAVIMIIIAGFKYITSNGDSGAVASAKNTIIYAIVGLVVVALAQVIVRFVTGKITINT